MYAILRFSSAEFPRAEYFSRKCPYVCFRSAVSFIRGIFTPLKITGSEWPVVGVSYGGIPHG